MFEPIGIAIAVICACVGLGMNVILVLKQHRSTQNLGKQAG